MLKEFVWKVFEDTGSLENYVFYKEIEEKNKILKETYIAEEEVAINN